jgi:hypothetical protein
MATFTLPRHIDDFRGSALGRVAFHEAGHAVIGRVLGLRVTSVAIAPCGDIAGYIEIPLLGTHPLSGVLFTDFEWMALSGNWKARVTIPTDKAMHAHIITLLSGAVAEKHFCGGLVYPGAKSDNAQIRRLVRYSQCSRERLKMMSQMLVRRHSSVIFGVALELARKKRLQGPELDRILGLGRGSTR